jgi:hypothetical protein
VCPAACRCRVSPPTQIALIWGLLASACCIFYPIFEAGPHIFNIMSHLMRCQTQESRSEAAHDTVKEVMPPQVSALRALTDCRVLCAVLRTAAVQVCWPAECARQAC